MGFPITALPKLHVFRKLPNFEPKLSKWYLDYVLVIFTKQIFVEKSHSPKYIIRPPLVIFFKNEEKNTSV